MAKFKVGFTQTVYMSANVYIVADTAEEAEALAIDKADKEGDMTFNWRFDSAAPAVVVSVDEE